MDGRQYPLLDYENAFEIYCALEKVFDQDRHGVVDGVEFDLRHPLLDPEEWGADTVEYRLKLPLLRARAGIIESKRAATGFRFCGVDRMKRHDRRGIDSATL